MIAVDEGALEADLAETYGIGIGYDYEELPVSKLATLSFYLRDDSRIKQKMDGVNYSMRDMMIATIADYAALYFNAIAGNRDMPELYTEILTGVSQSKGYNTNEEEEEIMTYETMDEFLELWKG